jgi:hypothetical protein
MAELKHNLMISKKFWHLDPFLQRQLHLSSSNYKTIKFTSNSLSPQAPMQPGFRTPVFVNFFLKNLLNMGPEIFSAESLKIHFNTCV